MAFERRVILPGSERATLPGSEAIGTVQGNEQVRVTVIVRRKGVDPVVDGGATREHLSHSEFAGRLGANPADIALVEKFAHASRLTVAESNLAKRRVMLLGTADSMSKAFSAELIRCRIAGSGQEFRGRTGALSIPVELEGIVVAVLGLDTRPVAKPHIRISSRISPTAGGPRATSAPSGTFTPPQVAALYNFPTGVTGAGQTIGIVELGGGYSTTDLQTYFSNLGISEPNVTAVSVDGGTNSPGSQADGEVMLDIEVAGSIAPGANIAVYFAPNTDQGFIDALTDAVHDTTRKPSVVSISWGSPEDSWTQQSVTAMNAALQDAGTLGVSVTVAAGDNGSTDGAGDRKLHVDFPASSPFSLACGGTTLQGSGNTISSEVVWNETANNEGATGGGVSNLFPLPAYQSSAGVPTQPETGFVGRGVPDVAGDADPTTGYVVLFGGQSQVVGGTSAVAPLWAALIALLNQQLGHSVGFVNTALYTLKAGFNDITSGNNDDSGLGYYNAGAGWDPCTGLGSPNGASIGSTLSSGSATTTSDAQTAIPGSAPKHEPQANWSGAASPHHQLTVTIVLRRVGDPETNAKQAEALLSGHAVRPSREEAMREIEAAPGDIAAVTSFARRHGLKIVKEDPASRTVQVQGTVQQMDLTFGVHLRNVQANDGQQYLSYEDPISLPKSLSGVVTAVLGLDQRPVAQHHHAVGSQ